ncbi:hypothetical protein DAI22_11g187300 [Oryza sativa Japonica Group]|nr:hypothetical protein DAI22_11g187300 [Oryza sativa Japonica Group]
MLTNTTVSSKCSILVFYTPSLLTPCQPKTLQISYADGRYVCFARNQDKWLICDAETVQAADSWELLLERFSDCRLQPEVLFFEVIK